MANELEGIDHYPMLNIHKPQELFVRVDRYTVSRYWQEGEERKRETLFYPSKESREEIKHIIKTIKPKYQSPGDRWICHMYKRLCEEGKADILQSVGVRSNKNNRQENTGRLKLTSDKAIKASKRSPLTVKQSITTRPKLNTITRPKLSVKTEATSKRRRLQCKE